MPLSDIGLTPPKFTGYRIYPPKFTGYRIYTPKYIGYRIGYLLTESVRNLGENDPFLSKLCPV